VRRIDSLYIFPGRSGVSPVNLWDAWRYALRWADIEDFRFHNLRHSAAAYLAMNGASPAEIAEVLGHKKQHPRSSRQNGSLASQRAARIAALYAEYFVSHFPGAAKTLSTVKRYTHLSEQHMARGVERMNTAIFGVVADCIENVPRVPHVPYVKK